MSSADLTDLDNFAHGFPRELVAEHRRVAPVYWHLEGFCSARLVRPVEWIRSNRHTGIRHLVVELAA